jgi:hypothetical protein
MPVVRIVMNHDGAQALLKSTEVQALLRQKAEAIAAAAGGAPEFVVDSRVGKARARASVRTGNFDGIRAEAEHRTLSSALDAGR